MLMQILLFVTIIVIVGKVNLLISQPLERSPLREFISYFAVVGGGIAVFTAIIVVVSMLFQ